MGVNIKEVQKNSSPHPFALVSAKKPDGRTNLMAISWWTYVSNNPPTIVICVSKKGLTGSLIAENKAFGLSIVSEALKDSAFRCGTCSGREADKAEAFGIAMTPADEIDAALVEAHKAALECRVVQTVDGYDHDMFIAEVVAAHIKPEASQLFAVKGYAALDTV